MHIPQQLAAELSLRLVQVESALELLAEGATVPFIARYRKERTQSMDEVQLRDLFDRFAYLTELQARKQTILESIAAQDKLTPELQQRIVDCLQKHELEDLYLPYRPKRRTKATIAKERGLEPLAQWLEAQNQSGANLDAAAIAAQAQLYVKAEKGIETAAAVLQGASDILAEAAAERAELRAYLRDYLLKSSLIVATIAPKKHPEGTTKFEMYRNYQAKTASIPAHNLLALFRGEAEGIVNFDLEFDLAFVQDYLTQKTVKTKASALRQFYRSMLTDAFDRLMKTSLINEVRSERKQIADLESIQTFETNLRELLLAAPAGMKPTLAIDPGFRTGCKVAVLDQTAKFLEYQAIFPHTGKADAAKVTVKQLIQKYQIGLIAIGNGTASRETDEFIGQVLADLPDPKPLKVIVNESGASIYSASDVAIGEFPDLDITVRGAISIGRRLQDPLAELVKLDPKSIGVGQYQHDVDQKLLKKRLDETVESCVNFVGVDLNTASQQLLTFVSGINATVANNIVQYRNEHGPFAERKTLLKVPKLGPKAYEQAAGFLRIRGGKNPLDNTAVHPERYDLVKTIAKDLQVDLGATATIAQQLQQQIQRYVSDQVGEPTLRDIVTELEKPGRDPRAAFQYATFRDDIREMRDLRVGMQLEGIVTNVANFGAFVDLGVHQDGLVHVSQLADRFVSDPKTVVKVGQVVQVRVLEVNEALKRISLSMRSESGRSESAPPSTKPAATSSKPAATSSKPAATSSKPAATSASLADLQAKFGKKR
jgi:protein Tex